MENIELLWTLGVVGVTVLIGFVVVPFLKAKGFIKREDIALTGILLEVVGLVIGEMKFPNEETKERSAVVLQVTQLTIKYVSNVMGDATVEQKKEMSIKASIEALGKLGVEATDARKKLIEMTVEVMLVRVG